MSKTHQLSDVQKCLLALYHDFKQFCEDNNIHYCAIGGTALGTVRHGGFIPWDDDIDVGIPIADYERFLKLVPKLPKHLGYAEVEWMGGKIYDNRTTIIETQFLSRPERYFGAFIDIFPVIGTPNDDSEREAFTQSIKDFFLKAQFFTCYPQLCDFDLKDLRKEKNAIMHKYDYETSDYVASVCYCLYKGNGFRNPVKDKKFEDTTMPLSPDYDWDLTNFYGDYMKLPPEEQRITHAGNMYVDLNTPCAVYQKEYEQLPDWVKVSIQTKHGVEGSHYKYLRELEKAKVWFLSEIDRYQAENQNLYSQIDELNAKIKELRSRKTPLGTKIYHKLKKRR